MITEKDRYWLERKYHDPDQPFDPFSRMAYLGAGYLENSGLDESELLEGLRKLEPQLKKMPHPIARAEAIRYVLANERLYLNEHDYFVGLYALNRLANSVTFWPWEAESRRRRDPELVELAEDFNRSGAVMIWTDYDHVVPDWKALMELGFPGIRQRARDYRQLHRQNGTMTPEMDAFFQGIEVEYMAILELLDRMYHTVAALHFEKAQKIATCLKHLRDGKPTDFYEALQLIYLYFIISESIDSYQVRSLGNGLDGTLLPFYRQDLKSGRYTQAEMADFLSYFLMQWSAIGNYWGQPFYLGGTNPDGSSKYTDLSRMILDVYDQLDIYNPKIQLKINENTPDWLLEKAFQMIRKKNASLVFCCEPAMIQAVMAYGVTKEEALQYDIRGCYETGVRGDEVSASSGYINAAKAVCYVFRNGFDSGIQKQVGAQTGEPGTLKTFEDFYNAFLRQWSHLIRQSMRITDDAERFLAFVNPSSLYSATIETSLKNGRDGYGGGVRFNNSAMLNCGFASAVDSVLAVKEFVYEKKVISLEEMAQALEQNWVGYEALRIQIRKSPHKYGNGDPVADDCARAMSQYFTDLVNLTPNGRGGVNKAICHSARAFLVQGSQTGALPDGRLSGEELSKNATPVMGMDRQGVTGVIRSACQLNPAAYLESFCLDLMLHPSTVAGAGGYAAFRGLLMTYLRAGGQSIQFNFFDAETLRDAQKHPEKYQNLQVRICGWNALWKNLSREEQNAYILRAEHAT